MRPLRPHQDRCRQLATRPVCHPCYQIIRGDPGHCARCTARRPLVGRDETTGAGICGPCAGADIGPCCRTCDAEGLIYAEGQCPRCALDARLTDLLAGPDGHITKQLAPLRDTLAQATRPLVIIRWLARSPAARLLAQLAATGRPITHDDLDAQPPSHGERYARHLLMHTGVLPDRDDDLDRIEPWLDQLLATRPAHQANLVRPFAAWHLLRRARRDAARRVPTPRTAGQIRSRIRVALDLLDWIDSESLTLAALSQADLERWFADGSNHRRTVRYFLAWAAERGLAPRHDIATPPQRTPTAVLDDQQRWQQLRRCLTDQQLPLEARVAGALILLYGLAASRIRRLTTTDIAPDGERTFLIVGSKPLLLPPSLADLLRELAESPRHRWPSVETSADGRRWLFPGVIPGRPLSVEGFSHMLRRQGIDTLPSRNAALVALAGQLPTPVLADALGIHIHTARHWASYLQRDWSAYIADRAAQHAEEQ